MQISCPKCGASGSIPDHEIPESGRFLSCPKCQEGFTVSKPKAGANTYLVDTCPSCGFSTYGEERFSVCPTCKVDVKSFFQSQQKAAPIHKAPPAAVENYERQLTAAERETIRKHGEKYSKSEPVAQPVESAAEKAVQALDNFHPVNLAGFGTLLIAIVAICYGVFAIIQYDGAAIQERLSENAAEKASMAGIFLQYGVVGWLSLLFGLFSAVTGVVIIRQHEIAMKLLTWHLLTAMSLIPILYIRSFIYWTLSPISHGFAGYFAEIGTMLIECVVLLAPLFFYGRYAHSDSFEAALKK